MNALRRKRKNFDTPHNPKWKQHKDGKNHSGGKGKATRAENQVEGRSTQPKEEKHKVQKRGGKKKKQNRGNGIHPPYGREKLAQRGESTRKTKSSTSKNRAKKKEKEEGKTKEKKREETSGRKGKAKKKLRGR